MLILPQNPVLSRYTSTGMGLKVIPISAGVACGLTLSNKAVYVIVMQKYIKLKKTIRKDQQYFRSFDELYRKS